MSRTLTIISASVVRQQFADDKQEKVRTVIFSFDPSTTDQSPALLAQAQEKKMKLTTATM